MKSILKPVIAASAGALVVTASLTLSANLPVLGIFLLLLIGVPGVFLLSGFGPAWFAFYGGLVIGLIVSGSDTFSGLLLFSMVVFPPAALLWSLKKQMSPLKAIAVSIFAATFLSTVVWAAAPMFGAAEIWSISDQIKIQGAQMQERIMERSEAEEIDPVRLHLIVSQLTDWVEFSILLIPVTLMFCWHVATLLTAYLVCSHFQERLGITIPPLPAFSSWRFDWNFIWLFIAGWLLFYGAGSLGIPGLKGFTDRAGANLLSISKVIYFIAGFSVVFHLLEFYKIRQINRVGLSLLAVLLSQATIWLGIIDVWYDFRAPKVVTGDNGSESFLDL